MRCACGRPGSPGCARSWRSPTRRSPPTTERRARQPGRDAGRRGQARRGGRSHAGAGTGVGQSRRRGAGRDPGVHLRRASGGHLALSQAAAKRSSSSRSARRRCRTTTTRRAARRVLFEEKKLAEAEGPSTGPWRRWIAQRRVSVLGSRRDPPAEGRARRRCCASSSTCCALCQDQRRPSRKRRSSASWGRQPLKPMKIRVCWHSAPACRRAHLRSHRASFGSGECGRRSASRSSRAWP